MRPARLLARCEQVHAAMRQMHGGRERRRNATFGKSVMDAEEGEGRGGTPRRQDGAGSGCVVQEAEAFLRNPTHGKTVLSRVACCVRALHANEPKSDPTETGPALLNGHCTRTKRCISRESVGR